MDGKNSSTVPKQRGSKDAISLDSLANRLAKVLEISPDDIEELRSDLESFQVADLKALAKHLRVRLTGASRKAEIVSCLIVMAQIDAIRENGGSSDDRAVRLTYITPEARQALLSLPGAFSLS